MEAYLESEVARWTRAVEEADAERAKLTAALSAAGERRFAVVSKMLLAAKMLDFYRKEEQTETNSETQET